MKTRKKPSLTSLEQAMLSAVEEALLEQGYVPLEGLEYSYDLRVGEEEPHIAVASPTSFFDVEIIQEQGSAAHRTYFLKISARLVDASIPLHKLYLPITHKVVDTGLIHRIFTGRQSKNGNQYCSGYDFSKPMVEREGDVINAILNLVAIAHTHLGGLGIEKRDAHF